MAAATSAPSASDSATVGASPASSRPSRIHPRHRLCPDGGGRFRKAGSEAVGERSAGTVSRRGSLQFDGGGGRLAVQRLLRPGGHSPGESIERIEVDRAAIVVGDDDPHHEAPAAGYRKSLR